MAWITLALLGAYHGLNPAMGWLFAVALGFQERRASAVLRALPPIVLGHAASVAVVISAVGVARLAVPPGVLRVAGAALLLGFAALLLTRRLLHPRWVGMRVGFRDLLVWSFLMASAHGAGLMLLPVLLRLSPPGAAAHASHLAAATAAHAPVLSGALALGVHTAAMLGAMTAAALLVYRVLGLGMLRWAWVNLDLLWGGALLVAGAVTLLPI